MKKQEIARKIARQAGVTQAEAADRLDLVVHRIVTNVRRGKSAGLPGLGTFRAGSDGRISFQRNGEDPRG